MDPYDVAIIIRLPLSKQILISGGLIIRAARPLQ